MGETLNFKIALLFVIVLGILAPAFADDNYYGDVEIIDVDLSDHIIYPGDVVYASVTVENDNDEATQFRFEYIVNNVVFEAGDITYIQPDTEIVIKVPIEVPDADELDITINVSNPEHSDKYSDDFLISSKTNYFFIFPENNSLYVELENKTSTYFDIKNTGTEDDKYKVMIIGWDDYTTNDTVFVNAGKTQRVNLTLDISSNTPSDSYAISIDVCNSNDTCKSKTIGLIVHKTANEESFVNWSKSFEHVKFNSAGSPIEYVFNITNKVNQEKNYRIVISSDSNITADVLARTFTLGLNEYKTIEFNLTPQTEENHTVELTIYNGNLKVLEKDLLVEYDEHYSGITGMFIGDIGGVYIPGLIALALIGTAFAVLTIYREVNKKVWTEKVISYQKRPNPYYTYMNSNPRHTMNQPQGPVNYPDNSMDGTI